jgi:hypothetical protein
MSWSEEAKKSVRDKGFHDSDSDYGGMIGQALDELIDTFSKQGHSGMSAYWVSNLFHALVQNDGYFTEEDKNKAFEKWRKETKDGLLSPKEPS